MIVKNGFDDLLKSYFLTEEFYCYFVTPFFCFLYS